ncbi:TolC family protein [Lewinella sp. LCG006]|uniref:TolC family protein n=1 Tax=Lewinella sp. LCG006 TaxID=3231911 RepID=UPI0034612568
MKFLLPIILFAFLLPSTVAHAQAVDSLSLDEFLRLAQTLSLRKQAAERDQQLANLDYQIFRAGLKPQLTLNANIPNYLKTFSEITQPDGTIRFEAVQNNNSALGLDLRQRIAATGGQLFLQTNLQRFDDFESDFSIYNGLPFRLGIMQPIFAYNPFKWERQLAPLRVAEAEANYQLDLEIIREEVTRLFFDLLMAGQESRIADTNFVANERLYAIAEERYELGKISRRDLLQLELEKISAQRAQINATQAVRQASAAVAVYLGQQPDEHSYLASTPEVHVAVDITHDQAMAWARAKRPEWLAFQRRLLEARQASDQARREGGPELSLVGAVGRVRSGTELATIYQEALPEAFLELQISVPILDGGRRRHQRERAEVLQSFAQASIAREQLTLENDVRTSVQQFLSLQEELKLATRLRELAAERFRITTESYILGAIPLSDLTLAQREKDQAARTYSDTQRAYWLAYASLRQLTLENI